MNLKLFNIFLLVALVSLPQQAYSQVYKWVDEDGKVHYGDQPPMDRDAERVEVTVSKSDASNEQAAEQRRERLKTLGASRKELEKSRADAANERRERIQQCDAARERYDRFVFVTKMHEIDEQGNKTYLSDEDRVRVKQEASDAVKELCD